jgi:UDP-glucose 4-epimerase
VRDYCYVDDLVDSMVTACDVPLPACRSMTLNVGSGAGTSVAELVDRIGRLVGRTLSIEESGQRDRPGQGEPFELVADCRRARDLLGWCPATTLNDGLRATLAAAGAK